MEPVIAWLGFLGAWLVVAGSVFQAALEFTAEREQTDRLRRAMGDVPAPPPVAKRWWLCPPVRLVLVYRRRALVRGLVIDTMSADDFELLARYVNKANGWLFVATGGTLLAMAETWALVDGRGWPTLVFVGFTVVMAGLSIGNAVARNRHTERALAAHRSRHHPG